MNIEEDILGNILVTGVSAGLGKALAHQYSMVGHTIYGLSRDKTKVDGCPLPQKQQIIQMQSFTHNS